MWKAFEKRIEVESVLQGITCVKIPEHIVRTKKGMYHKKTCFDYCAGVDGIAAFFDAKSTGRDFYIAHYIMAEEKIHQYAALTSASDNQNISGYLIHFYQDFQIVWITAEQVQSLWDSGVKKITPDTPGLSKQKDDVPINLRTLLWKDRAELMGKLCKG